VDTGSPQKMRPNKKLERRSLSIGSQSAQVGRRDRLMCEVGCAGRLHLLTAGKQTDARWVLVNVSRDRRAEWHQLGMPTFHDALSAPLIIVRTD